MTAIKRLGAEKVTYSVITTVQGDGTITQLVESTAGEISRWVTSTREAQVREALVALGWTPPGDPTPADTLKAMRDKDWGNLTK